MPGVKIPDMNALVTPLDADLSEVVSASKTYKQTRTQQLGYMKTNIAPLITKGDLATFSTVAARLGVGANGKILSANSAQTTGLEWIDASSGGTTVVEVDEGYVEVEDNTIYVISYDAIGKVYFQTPTIMPLGFKFEIIGQGGSPISNWNLSTQLNQSLINGTDITNFGSDRYAILEPSSPTDRVSFVCTYEDRDVSVEFSSSAGLTLYEQTLVVDDLDLIIASTPLNINMLVKAYSTYSDALIEIQRDSDNATCLVSPDLTNRASPLSMTDQAMTVAEWGYGANVTIITIFEQSGTGADLVGGAYWLSSAGTMTSISGNPAARFFGSQSMEALYSSNYTGSNLNVFVLATVAAAINSESAIVNLFDPANGDDYSSTLNSICFRQPPPGNTVLVTTRSSDLSSNTFPAIDQRMILTTTYDGTNNTQVLNGVAGTPVASTGAFSFDRCVLATRWVGGGPANPGYYDIGAVAVFGTMGGGDFASVRDWMNTYL